MPKSVLGGLGWGRGGEVEGNATAILWGQAKSFCDVPAQYWKPWYYSATKMPKSVLEGLGWERGESWGKCNSNTVPPSQVLL